MPPLPRRALISAYSRDLLDQTDLLPVIEVWYAPLTVLAGGADPIAQASQSAGCVLITEDRDVRRAATEAGIAVSAFLGLLLEAKRRGLVANAEEFITRARVHGFQLSPKAVHAALIMSGEIEAAHRLS